MNDNWTPVEETHFGAPIIGHCNRCHRATWDEDQFGRECRMTQPDGNPCGGMFQPSSPEGDTQ